MSIPINPAIFRAYDIRGLVDIDLTDDVYFMLGQATGTHFRQSGTQMMVVGRDARLSSPHFQTALMEGLRSTGINVTDIGQVPTPVMYFAVEHLHADGGAVVSASHNPPQYNGLKLRLSHSRYGSEPVSGSVIQEIGRIARSGQFVQGSGALSQTDVSDAYVRSVASHIRLPAHFRPRVVLDGGNGVAGPLGVRTLEAVGIDVTPLYIEPDGTFPNHHPDPLKPENVRDLIAAVRKTNADMGIALDGDGDRLGVVDSNGVMVMADRYLIVLARYLLSQRKGAVIFDVKCSTVLEDAILALGGEPIMWKTGYSNISAKMRETDAVLGGELSGHTFATFPKHYYDDGTFAGAHLLYALNQLHSDAVIPAPSLVAALASYSTLPALPEERLFFSEETKFRVIDYVRQYFADRYPVIDIDGVRVNFGDGWGLVRPSNTEAAITTRFEAQTEVRLQAIRATMLEAVEEFRARTGGK
ncbi:MAG: phosphomannomutase/phosphoglucomutase [Chloroflexales bacterium]|nr:phosphomannomutase/phosphoglucomutase [Chloroflexales bacterium]